MNNQQSQKPIARGRWWIPILLVFFIGIVTTWQIVLRTDRKMREERLHMARLLAYAVNIESIKALTGTKADLNSPVYLRLKAQFAAAKKTYPKCRFIYLMGRRDDGKVFFYVDNEAPGSENESPAGQIYAEISPEYLCVFDTQSAKTVGPVPDRWGTWISSLVPLNDPQTGKLLAVLGIDMDADKWQAALIRDAIVPSVMTLVLIIILLIGMILSRRRQANQIAHKKLRLLGPRITLMVGVVSSLFLAWLVYNQELSNYQERFCRLADAKSAALMERFHKLQNVELEGLARFVENSREVEIDEFQHYTGHLIRNNSVQAWEWIPVVPAKQRKRVEMQARASGISNFTIWQKNFSGRRVPVEGRTAYYPVYYVSPLSGNESAVGFDLGSEPLRRMALEKAMKTGMMTCSDPIKLVQEKGKQQAILVYRPIFTSNGSRKLRGFVLAVLRMGDVLQSVKPDRNILMSLSLGCPESKSILLVSPVDFEIDSASRCFTTRPILAFGKTFFVNTSPGPDYEEKTYSMEAAGLVLFSGIIITIAIATLISSSLQRRHQLEKMVTERTAELLESTERFEQLAKQSRTFTWEVDANGLYTYVNRTVSAILGYKPKELIAKMHFYDLYPEAKREQFKKEVMDVFVSNNCFRNVEHQALTKSKKNIWLNMTAIPMFDDSGKITGYRGSNTDITERRQMEASLRKESERNRILRENASDGVHLLDLNGNVVDANDAFCAMLGRDRSEIIGVNVSEWDNLWKKEELSQIIHEHFDGGTRVEFSTIHRRKDGTLFNVQISGMPVELDGIFYMFYSSRDITEQRQAEDSLRAERDLFTAGPVFTISWLPLKSWPVIFVSENVQQILGYSPMEMTSESFCYEELIHPEDLERVVEEVGKYFDSDIIHFEQSYRLRTRFGEYRWFHDFTRLIRDDSGAVVSFHGYMFDQTDFKNAQLQVLNERERLTHVINGTNVGTWEWNVQTGETIFNERWAEICGYTLAELEPISIDTWMKLAHPDDLQESGKILERHFSGELEVYDHNVRMKHKDGSWVWVHDRGRVVSWTSDGKPLKMFGTHGDVTERKRAEERLKSNEENFRTFFESMNDMIFVGDTSGKIIFTNAAVTKKLGYTSDELLQSYIFEVHPQETRDDAKFFFEAMMKGRQTSCPCPLLAKNGKRISVETRVWLGKWNDKDCIFGLSKDLTAEQEAQQRFERLFRGNPSPMALSSLPDRRLVDVNDAFLRTLGYNHEEVVGRRADELRLYINPEVHAITSRKIQSEGRVLDLEFQVLRKDGSVLDGLFSAEKNYQSRSGIFTHSDGLTSRIASGQRKSFWKPIVN